MAHTQVHFKTGHQHPALYFVWCEFLHDNAGCQVRAKVFEIAPLITWVFWVCKNSHHQGVTLVC